MSLLIDVFGYLSIILHGLTIVAQSVALGTVVFLVALARPLAMGEAGPAILSDSRRIGLWGAAGLALASALSLALQLAILAGTLPLPLGVLLTAQSSLALLAKLGCALALMAALARSGPAWLLLGLGGLELVAATLTTHAAARLSGRGVLLPIEALHQLGAAIWIGGLPCFVAALGQVRTGAGFRAVGARFSRLSMLGVGCIVISGVVMSVYYIGGWSGFYGTAYGIMVAAKIAMLGLLLLLGAANFLLVERLRTVPQAPVARLRRFAEVEIGIGFSVFFAAASLTSVPPAIDQARDRVTWHEVVERNAPRWPRMVSPEHGSLALPALQAQLDRQAAARAAAPEAAFVPGAGLLPPRNADDIAWSEYNHHWAGVFVVLVGILALLHRAGLRWARHWPLGFLGLAVFLFLRSDPEVWPLGVEGFFASLRDVEVFQHRIFVLLVVVFALFEWRVQVGALGRTRAALVFPLLTAAGGALLLTHSHAIANVHDQVLIELTHTPLALAGIVAGWSRWLELRLGGAIGRVSGWVWPGCFVLIGAILLLYREA